MTYPLTTYVLVLSALFFTVGIFMLTSQKNSVFKIIIAANVMITAAIMNFLFFALYHHNIQGYVLAFFVITLTVSDIAIGLAVIRIYLKNHPSDTVGKINSLKG